jgi:hypothetical protein
LRNELKRRGTFGGHRASGGMQWRFGWERWGGDKKL